jgi:hypothetical protein
MSVEISLFLLTAHSLKGMQPETMGKLRGGKKPEELKE